MNVFPIVDSFIFSQCSLCLCGESFPAFGDAPVSPSCPEQSRGGIYRFLAPSKVEGYAESRRKSFSCRFYAKCARNPFIYRIYEKHRGCGGSPICSNPPQRAKSFASYYIPATLAVSCDYVLFGATAARQTFSHQEVTHSFYRNGGVSLTLLRKNKTPRG
jgi:hypothetical protein